MNLDNEIQQIDTKVYKMLDVVINACKTAFQYYLHGEYDAKLEIDDDKINLYEREIESLCMQILLKEKVYSGDLRQICGNFKLVEDVERIGDQAFDIKHTSDLIKRLDGEIKVIPGMEEIIDIVMKMVEDSLYCCVKMDEKLANDILKRDDIVDAKFWEVVKTIVKYNEEKKIAAYNTVYQTMIVKYLERIADHATNIAEWLVYIISGFHKDQVVI